MKGFTKFLREQDAASVDCIVVVVPESLVNENALLNESKWSESKKSGWSVRVDAANPSIKGQRHVVVSHPMMCA